MSACPKCGAVDEQAGTRGACARCGLRADLWASFDPKPAPHAELDVAFAALASRWDDPTAHDTFLRLASSLGVLDGAAARYRQVLRGRTGDPQSQRALGQLAVFVTQLERSAPREYLRRWRAFYYVAVVLAAGLCVGAGLFVWHLRQLQLQR